MKRILLALALLCAIPAFASTTTLKDAVRLTGSSSPSQWTGNQDNYALGANVSVLRISTDASRDLTGIANGYAGRVLVIHNVGAQDLVLKDASGSSSAANQFALTGDVTLNADAVAILQYDGTSTKWRLAGTSGGTAIAHSSLTGLTSGDDHTQYALLAGRSGGQTLIGGTAAGNNLTLKSTSNASKGSVIIQGTNDFLIYDATDTSVINLRHTGTDAIFESSAGDIHVQPAGGDVKIFDAGYLQSLNLKHDATDGTISTSTGDLFINPTGSTITRTAALATNATDGFLYIPSSAGKPTGTPTSQTGTVPLHADSTNNVVWAYQNSLWQQIGGAAILLPANAQRTGGVILSTSGNITTTSDTAYWQYMGYTLKPCTITYVECQVTTGGTGAQTAEIALASSTSAPNRGNQTLTKLTANGTLDDLTTTSGTKRNTVSLSYSCAAGVHLWAGIRTAMATNQPAFLSVGRDWGNGQLLSTAGAGALTGTGPWTGTVVTDTLNAACPQMRIVMD